MQVLRHDFKLAGITLHKGDRLEPSPELMDWAKLEETMPTSLTFWRRSSESFCKHRCVLFDPGMGTCLEDICAIDSMHTIVLGIMSQLVLEVCWSLMSGNPWKLDFPFEAQEVKHQRNMAHMALLWKRFYRGYKSDVHQLSDISDWKIDKLGTKEEPKLYLKAGQTLSFLRFLAAEIGGWSGPWDKRDDFVRAVKLMMTWYEIMEGCGVIVPEAKVQEGRRDEGHQKTTTTPSGPILPTPTPP